ncbi:rootletin-like [Serinus canaria]|uniref:rootletin-like n=1 Tax=Serinus canaria TaxID=9135 RepID=UPI0021CCE4DB|nr:rootletin-like [Serinus canaria]
MEASQATRQKKLLKELEEARAQERSLRDSVHVLEAEVSELHVKLQSSEDKALALAIQCKAVELELRKTEAQRDNLRACNLELQKELEECEQEWWKEEARHISRETALEKEATERWEESVTLRQEVESLKKKLGIMEKERKDVLHGRALYQQQMRDLERKNEMLGLNIQSQQERTQQLGSEKETMQEELKHGAAALKKGRGNTLSSAMTKFKIAKGALQKRLAFQKGKSCIQPGTDIDLHSPASSLNYSRDVSHGEQAVGAEEEQLFCGSRTSLEFKKLLASAEKEKRERPELSTVPRRSGEQQAVGAQEEQLFRGSRTSLESKKPLASAEEEKRERPELSTVPRRSGEQVGPERRRTRTFRRVFLPDYFILPVQESAHQNQSTFEIEESSSSSGEW